MSRGRQLVNLALQKKSDNVVLEKDSDVSMWENTEALAETQLSEALLHDVIFDNNNCDLFELPCNPEDIVISNNLLSFEDECDNKTCKLVDYSSSDQEALEKSVEKDRDTIEETSDNAVEATSENFKAIEESDTSAEENNNYNNISEGQSEGEFTESTSSSENESPVFFRGKRQKKLESAKERNKKSRLMGESYMSYRNIEKKKKEVLPNPCFKKRCNNKCHNFTEDERKELFRAFWAIKSNAEKHSFINGCVNVVAVKRKRTASEHSRRGLTYQYFLMSGKCQQRVCLQFLLNTLNITQKYVRNSLEGKIRANSDLRGCHEPKHSISSEQMDEFKLFIENLPAVPSHYCRGSSKKLYLPAEIKTFANLYRMYTETVKEKHKNPISMACFRKYLKRDYNIGIHVPKKDKCAKCERFKNIPKEMATEKENTEYLNHQKEKNEAKIAFLNDQNYSTQEKFLVATFDLQKVLSTPHGQNMMYGFSRKYAVYNFTIYESKSQNGYCYLWGERDGKRGVIEICSHLYNYLSYVDVTGEYERISFYCDNCPGQNKNKFILAMLAYFLKNTKNIKEISLTYLVAGHTYMPVDSMHAVIEKYASKINVQAPSEWPTIIRNTRRKPKPYEVTVCTKSAFKDWKTIAPKKLKSKEGSEVKFLDIKRVKMTKSGLPFIEIKKTYDTDESPELVELSIRPLKEIPCAYLSDLPINKKKLDNLLDLCKKLIIKKEYHSEYFSLSSNASVPDILNESDIEDL